MAASSIPNSTWRGSVVEGDGGIPKSPSPYYGRKQILIWKGLPFYRDIRFKNGVRAGGPNENIVAERKRVGCKQLRLHGDFPEGG